MIKKNDTWWFPIEDAPLDRVILIAFYDVQNDENHIKISYWSDAEKGWSGVAQSVRIGDVIVTHWTYLPEHPSE